MRKAILHITFSLSCCFAAFYSPLSAIAQTPEANPVTPLEASQDLDRTLETAMRAAIQAVSAAQIDSPDAARIYALTAIGLHDSYSIAGGQPGIIAKDIAPHSPQAQELMQEVSHIIVTQSLGQPLPVATSLAHHMAEQILEQHPRPDSATLQLRGDWLPMGAPVLSNWASAKPLLLSAPDQFRAPGPAAQSSSRYKDALERVTRMGQDASASRTQAHLQSAQFWADDKAQDTLPALWNLIALDSLQSMDTQSRLNALLALNIALYDTSIAAWDTKYHYQSARPDGVINSQNSAQNWAPTLKTPHHPEYISSRAAYSGAAAHILTQKIGAAPFCISIETSALEANIAAYKRQACFDDFQDAAQQAAQSGIYAGHSFDFSSTDGLALGQNVARHTLKNLK